LQSGDWIPVITGKRGILAFHRILRKDKIFVLLNFRKRPVKIFLPLPEKGIVLISTHRPEHTLIKPGIDMVFPFEASVFRINS
jgi:hypothetical protein